MYKLIITSNSNVDNLQQALKPELAKSDRFESTLSKKDNLLEVTVEAQDATALKAIATSLLKLIEISEKIHGKK